MHKPTRARRKGQVIKSFNRTLGHGKQTHSDQLRDQQRIVSEGAGEPSNNGHLIAEPRTQEPGAGCLGGTEGGAENRIG